MIKKHYFFSFIEKCPEINLIFVDVLSNHGFLMILKSIITYSIPKMLYLTFSLFAYHQL